MKLPLAILASALLAHSLFADWTPPENPSYEDTFTIAAELHDDVKAGRHADALAKLVWCQNNAVKINFANYGLLLANLTSWAELAAAYPPANDALREARVEAAKAVLASTDRYTISMQFGLIAEANRLLDRPDTTRSFFLETEKISPGRAVIIYTWAEPALIHLKDYATCNKYLDADVRFGIAAKTLNSAIMDAEQTGNDDNELDDSKAYFTHEVATLVGLLAANDRPEEARRIAGMAEFYYGPAPIFHAAMMDALKGHVPPPQPAFGDLLNEAPQTKPLVDFGTHPMTAFH